MGKREPSTPAAQGDAGHSHTPADEVLVSRCQGGDETAYAELYELYARSIFRHLRALVGPTEDVEGAVQTVFEQAFRSIHRFRGESRVSTWLHGIAIKVALNARRARDRRRNAMGRLALDQDTRAQSMGATADDRIAWREQATRLDRHLAKLSDAKRTAFILYYVQELDLPEVAARMGTSPETTWTRIKRARAEVARAMAKYRNCRQQQEADR